MQIAMRFDFIAAVNINIMIFRGMSPSSHISTNVSGRVGFVVDKVPLGQVSSEYFGFPCQFSFHQMLRIHVSSGAGTIGQLLTDVPSGLSLAD
jgi:hypothetical protein